MCGICGIVAFQDIPIDAEKLKLMCSLMAHRGPDNEGYWITPYIGLGHRRLSIIDLTTGHQPMCNEDKTVWIVYNGETYNYIELKEELIKKGHTFSTSSDTEVLVHLYEEYGDRFVELLNGSLLLLFGMKKRKD